MVPAAHTIIKSPPTPPHLYNLKPFRQENTSSVSGQRRRVKEDEADRGRGGVASTQNTNLVVCGAGRSPLRHLAVGADESQHADCRRLGHLREAREGGVAMNQGRGQQGYRQTRWLANRSGKRGRWVRFLPAGHRWRISLQREGAPTGSRLDALGPLRPPFVKVRSSASRWQQMRRPGKSLSLRPRLPLPPPRVRTHVRPCLITHVGLRHRRPRGAALAKPASPDGNSLQMSSRNNL